MKNVSEIFDDISMIDIEDKIQLIDRLLNSLYPAVPNVDRFWQLEAEKRVRDLRSGKYKPIEGEQVFNEIREKYYR